MGKPGFPIPLRTGCARPHPPAGGGVGKPGFPIPCFGARLSRGRGRGETRFPHTLLRGQALPRAGAWGNPVSPYLASGPGSPAGRGWGNPVSPYPCARAAPAHTLLRAGAWGNPVSPYPCARAAPAQTLLRAGAWGNPVSPYPCARAAPAQTLLRAGAWGNPVSPYPCFGARLSRGPGRGQIRFPHTPAHGHSPHLPAGGGVGEPGSPSPLRTGCARPNPPAGEGMGEPGSPMFTLALFED